MCVLKQTKASQIGGEFEVEEARQKIQSAV